MNGIYVTSKRIHAPMWRDKQRLGVPIISTWIDEETFQISNWNTLWDKFIFEASSCDILIVYAEPYEEITESRIAIGCALSHQIPVIAVVPDSMCDTDTWLNHQRVQRIDCLDSAISKAVQFCERIIREDIKYREEMCENQMMRSKVFS